MPNQTPKPTTPNTYQYTYIIAKPISQNDTDKTVHHMAELILEKKPEDQEKNLLKNLKKYRLKISMIKPYEITDFWTKKPDPNNALEIFINELLTLDPNKYFKIEVTEN
jgi:glutamate synthase domain-containing protein 3